MAKANGKAAAPVEPPRKEIFYGSPDEQRVCYGSAQHTASGGGLCLDQNAIRIGEWKLIVGDGGMPNTWFAPVNASQDEHDQEQSQCVDADETYLHGYNSESPFLPGAGSPTHTAVQVAADEKQHETAWTCSNKTSWTEGECRPGELVAVNCLTTPLRQARSLFSSIDREPISCMHRWQRHGGVEGGRRGGVLCHLLCEGGLRIMGVSERPAEW